MSGPKPVVVGSGFGRYVAARKGRKPKLDLTLLPASRGMPYQPSRAYVAIGALDRRFAARAEDASR